MNGFGIIISTFGIKARQLRHPDSPFSSFCLSLLLGSVFLIVFWIVSRSTTWAIDQHCTTTYRIIIYDKVIKWILNILSLALSWVLWRCLCCTHAILLCVGDAVAARRQVLELKFNFKSAATNSSLEYTESEFFYLISFTLNY